ncbi:hypothetical protein V8F06_001076 [Rhypophila decipiens]
MGDTSPPTALALEPPPNDPDPKETVKFAPGLKCEIKHLEERNTKGNRKISPKPDKDIQNDEEYEDHYVEYAMVSIQVLKSIGGGSDSDSDSDRNLGIKKRVEKVIKKRLRINSPHICKALAEVIPVEGQSYLSYYPDQLLLPGGGSGGFESPPLEIESPFALLFHCQEELRDWHENHAGSEEERKHLDILFDYLSKEPSSAAVDWVNSGRITFDLLWYIFRPGDYVCARMSTGSGGRGDDDHWRVFWLERTSKEWDYNTDQYYLALECLYTASDGTDLGKRAVILEVPEREFPGKGGAREINKLSIRPLKCLDDNGTGIKRLAGSRSKEFLALDRESKTDNRGAVLKRYNGVCEIFLEEAKLREPRWKPHMIVGRVLIDTKAFMEEHPSEKIDILPWEDEDANEAEVDRKKNNSTGNDSKDSRARAKRSHVLLPDDRDILCPPYVYGYCLGIRKWCRFFLGNFSEPGWDGEVWDKHLILPSVQKKLLRSMIMSHSLPQDAEATRDEEALKGKGLVLVLHGPPGTGKTLTAVAIAEETNKPLLLYPAGELGFTLDTIQSGITRIIRYASRWKAILLVDEADVFLESREAAASGGGGGATAATLERSALAAVFLRQLEYCQAIIFLTSNRAQTFDPAIKSRVHLSLYYPAPDQSTRRHLWDTKFNNLIAASHDKVHADFDKTKALDMVTRYALNGREISNMFNSALTLAASEREKKLKTEHLTAVLKVWEDASNHFSGRSRRMGMMAQTVLDLALHGLGLLVLLGLAVIITLHGYQIVFKGNRDVLILYR